MSFSVGEWFCTLFFTSCKALSFFSHWIEQSKENQGLELRGRGVEGEKRCEEITLLYDVIVWILLDYQSSYSYWARVLYWRKKFCWLWIWILTEKLLPWLCFEFQILDVTSRLRLIHNCVCRHLNKSCICPSSSFFTLLQISFQIWN